MCSRAFVCLCELIAEENVWTRREEVEEKTWEKLCYEKLQFLFLTKRRKIDKIKETEMRLVRETCNGQNFIQNTWEEELTWKT